MKMGVYKKNILICLMILIVVLIGTIIIIFSFSKKKVMRDEYDKSLTSIVVQATKKGEAETKTTTIDIANDGKNAEVITSFMSRPVYITAKGTLYEDGGRFKRVNSKHSYDDVYDVLAKIETESNDGSYHPKISYDTINNLLECLFIDYELTEDTIGNLTLVDNKIEEFSVYLRDFYGYDKLGIIVMFENKTDDYEVKVPVFYDEVIDETDERELRFID